jgi:hypothetical protein
MFLGIESSFLLVIFLFHLPSIIIVRVEVIPTVFIHRLFQLPIVDQCLVANAEKDTHHLNEFVALAQVGDDNGLAFRDGTVRPDELAIFSHRIDLM